MGMMCWSLPGTNAVVVSRNACCKFDSSILIRLNIHMIVKINYIILNYPVTNIYNVKV
jgi:hypothetical protein